MYPRIMMGSFSQKEKNLQAHEFIALVLHKFWEEMKNEQNNNYKKKPTDQQQLYLLNWWTGGHAAIYVVYATHHAHMYVYIQI